MSVTLIEIKLKSELKAGQFAYFSISISDPSKELHSSHFIMLIIAKWEYI